MSIEQEHSTNNPTAQELAVISTEKNPSEKCSKTHNIFLIDKAKLNLSESSIENALGLLMSEDEGYELQEYWRFARRAALAHSLVVSTSYTT